MQQLNVCKVEEVEHFRMVAFIITPGTELTHKDQFPEEISEKMS